MKRFKESKIRFTSDEFEREDDDFRVRPGYSKEGRGAGKRSKFLGSLRAKNGGQRLRVFSKTKRKRNKSKAPKPYRRVTVKALFSRIDSRKGQKNIKRHTRYLERSGVGEEGKDPLFFNQERSAIPGSEVREEIQKWHGDRHYFRFIVSPEDGAELDLRRFSREFIDRLEGDLFTRLEYFAVPHYNTDLPHVHFLIRGKRDNKKDLLIPREYMSHGMRGLLEDIALEFLGPKPEREVKREKERQVKQERFTGLDYALLKNAEDHIVNLKNKRAPWLVRDRNLYIERLKYLRTLGLAKEIKPAIWELEKSIKQTLFTLGKRGYIVRNLFSSAPDVPYRDVQQFNPKVHIEAPLMGKVIGRGVANELSDTPYVLIKDSRQQVHYLELKEGEELEASELREGDNALIHVNAKPAQLKKSDKNIDAMQKQNGGVYNVLLHKKWAADNIALPRGVSLTSYIENHRKRIESLALKGVVKKIDNDTYLTSSNFLENIEKHSRDSGKLAVKAVSFSKTDTATRGISFLDYAKESDNPEVRKRKAFLKTEGIETYHELYKLELSEAYERLKADYGNPHKGTEPVFKGNVRDIRELPSGPHYVAVGKGSFMLLPVTHGNERLSRNTEIRVRSLKKSEFIHPQLTPLQKVTVTRAPKVSRRYS
jgi:type IV secretory pathway VirD2 relaxase